MSFVIRILLYSYTQSKSKKMVSVKTKSVPKCPSPQQFIEPEGMITVDLNQSEQIPEDGAKKCRITFATRKTIKLILSTLILLVFTAICVITFVLLPHTDNPFEDLHTSKIKACKHFKTPEDCCHLFVKRKLLLESEACTADEVVNLILQYELAENGRQKRQVYQNPQSNPNQNSYYQYEERDPRFEFNPSPPEDSPTRLPKTCPDNNCPTVAETTSKIANISKISSSNRNLEIAMNGANIQLKNARISQGQDFENIKLQDSQTAQSKIPPCIIYPSNFRSSGFDSNNMFSVVQPMVQQQPLYILNPSIYPNHFVNPQPVYFPTTKSPSLQVTGPGGQFYICNPIPPPATNIANMPGVEVREAFHTQELVGKEQRQNKTRQSIVCMDDSFSCVDLSRCIPSRMVCDNEVQCSDASDELDCSCRDRLSKDRICDHFLDCPHGEDEDNCFGCSENEFSCDDGLRFRRGTCIPIEQRCDGVKNCDYTGKDEEDCSILTDHVGHHPLHKISNSIGFLHRNYQGKWYPTCAGSESLAQEVCHIEAGPSSMSPKTEMVLTNENYEDLFLNFTTNGISLSNSCMEQRAAYVECPAIYCGMRLITKNPFRLSEVDTSDDDEMHSVDRSLGSSRIVGGKACQPAAWPWIVTIYKNGVFHCGGVLINENWVLSAAHCFDKHWLFYYEIHAGLLRRFSYSPMEQTRFVRAAIPHEEYDKKTLRNDIAVVKLSRPVRFNRYVRPICLPSELTAGVNYLNGPPPNTICTTVGWGSTFEHGPDPDQLREVDVPILPFCKHQEDQKGDEICAGLLDGGRDACQGDSGGPLMCRNPNNPSQWYVAGIVSHGEGCARPNEPGVYTKVSKFQGWISDNIAREQFVKLRPLEKCPGYSCKRTKRCLPKKRQCDRVVDCLLGDDEYDCPFVQFALQSQVLGVPFSKTEWNETEVKKENIDLVVAATQTFVCTKMLQRISADNRCDKKADCEDATDEENCHCRDYLWKWHPNAICDGITDCRDLTDEQNCSLSECSADEYYCRISRKCVPSSERCDGKLNCERGEDEWDCVALTDGRTLILDSDLRPKQSMKGIITINRFGVWRPLCTNAFADSVASIATNVCNLLGFEEYTVFHKLPVDDKPLNVTIERSSLEAEEACGGLFVECSNVSRDVQEDRDWTLNQTELYSVPWSAVIYLDGKFRCIGMILNTRWILAPLPCVKNILEIQRGYIAAILGKGQGYLDIEGPYDETFLISKVVQVQETNAVLLKTKKRISFKNRHLKAANFRRKEAIPQTKQCMTILSKNGKLQITPVEVTEECPISNSCFNLTSLCQDNSTGIIYCLSRRAWHPEAILDSCLKSNFSSIFSVKQKIEEAMRNKTGNVTLPDCEGFRCNLGQCIQKNKVCNGIPDCKSGEDEDSNICENPTKHCHLTGRCNTTFSDCSPLELRCGNDKCVPKTAFCDGVDDCGDLSDEPEICYCGNYLNLTHPEQVCDGRINCADRSDENPEICGCRNPPSHFICNKDDGLLCISEEMVCDSIIDCPGGEDEKNCFALNKVMNLSLDSNAGEVMQRTGGLWHSGCFTENEDLNEVCNKLGIEGATGSKLEGIPDDVGKKPVKDSFGGVWIRRNDSSKLLFRMRSGNKPLYTFVNHADCHKLFIECV